MLEALIAYAQQQKLILEPGFAAKRVRWLVNFDALQKQFNVTEADPINKKARIFSCCPDLRQSDLVKLPKVLAKRGIVSKSPAHFLFDTSDRIVLYAVEDAKIQARHDTFAGLIRIAAQELFELEPIAEMLVDKMQLEVLQEQLRLRGAKGSDKLSFAIDNVPILEQLWWHDWWRNFRATAFPKKIERQMICLASGEIVTAVYTHPKLKSLVTEKVSFGTPVITADKPAFASYRLEKAQNAATSELAAVAYHAAFEHLLQKSTLIQGTKAVYWYGTQQPLKIDPFRLLFEPDRYNENASFASLKQLKVALAQLDNSLKPINYHFAVLQGREGRARVLMYQAKKLETLVDSFLSWLVDTDIAGSGDADSVLANPHDFLSAFYEPPKSKKGKAQTGKFNGLLIPLYQTMLEQNQAVPFTVVAHMLQALLLSISKSEFIETKNNSANTTSLRTLRARMGILKAFHRRAGDHQLQKILNPNHPDKHYQAGRLAALIETTKRITAVDDDQYLNHKQLLQTIKLPSETLKIQFESLQSKLSRIAVQRPWISSYLSIQMQKIWLVLAGSVLSNASLEAQTMFMLGYFQQFVSDQTRLQKAVEKNTMMEEEFY